MSESRENYRSVKEKTVDFFNKYKSLVPILYSSEEAAKKDAVLEDRKRQLDSQEFSLVVIGEMKHGKSTFLNAMLRKPVFSKDVREATAAVTFLRHNDSIRGKHPEWCDKAVVEFTNRPAKVVDHMELGKYTTCLNRGEINVAEDVDRVTIYSDSEFVKDGVTVVDTPGMNTTSILHEQITRDQIDRSHAAVFLFKAGEAGKKSDYEFLGETSKKIDRFFFVVNRIDEIGGIGENSNRVIEDLKSKVATDPKLGPLLKNAKFYPTAGLLALLARYPEYIENEKFSTKEIWEKECNSSEKRVALEKASGMEEFEESLLKFLFKGERTRDFLKSHLTFMSNAIDEAKRFVAEQRDVLNDKTDLNELEERQKRLEVEYERECAKVASTSSELTEKLAKSMKDFVANCETEANTKCNEFKETVNEINDYDALRRQFETLSMEVDRLTSRFSSRSQEEMKDVAQSVFSSVDVKLRGELNKSLGKNNLFELPEMEPPKIEWVVPEDAAKEFEEKITSISKELDEVNLKLEKVGMADFDLQNALLRKKDLEEERSEVIADINNKFQILGSRPGVEQKMVRPEHDTKEWRGGLLGGLATLFIGKKTVHHEAEYITDDSAQKQYDADMQKLHEKESKMKDDLRKRLDDARNKVSEAQRAQLEREALMKIQANKEQKERELQRKLRERQQKERDIALAKMKSNLVGAMNTQFTSVVDSLRAMSSSCAKWAADYIGGIQTELSDVVKARKSEIESLCQSVNMKKKDRDDKLAVLDNAEGMIAELVMMSNSLALDIDSMAM